MLREIEKQHQILNNKLHTQLGKKESLETQIADYEKRLETIDLEFNKLTKSSLFLQTLSDSTRQQLVDKISFIVTDALQKIKDPNLEFKMVVSNERNQVDLKFLIVNSTTKQEYDILQSCGGTVADIITFLLRIILISCWEPKLSKLLLLDECFKFVSVYDQDKLGEFIKTLTEQMKTQVILITHSEKLANTAHKVFDVKKIDEQSKVEEKI